MFSKFSSLFGLKSVMPVRPRSTHWPEEDQLEKFLPPASLYETGAVIKSVCVALHMEFLIVLSCGGARGVWREREKAGKGREGGVLQSYFLF